MATKTKPAPAPTTIHAEYGTGSQSIHCTETLDFAGRKLRVRIHRDTSYLFQSHAYVEAFDPTAAKWNRIADVHYSRMQTQPTPYAGAHRAMPMADTFRRDRDALVAQALALLS